MLHHVCTIKSKSRRTFLCYNSDFCSLEADRDADGLDIEWFYKMNTIKIRAQIPRAKVQYYAFSYVRIK